MKNLQVQELTLAFADREILRDVSFNMNEKTRCALAGANGCGKTTLLNIIAETIKPDSGHVEVGETIRRGYYTQTAEDDNENQTIIDYLRESGDYMTLADGRRVSAESLLEQFLFPRPMQHSLVSKLSGGERKRLRLLRLLMSGPNCLLLDEPTNDLDIPTLVRLEAWLDDYPNIVIIVSHDRYFLDRCADRLFYFGNGKIQEFVGDYETLRDYINKQAEDQARQQKMLKEEAERAQKAAQEPARQAAPKAAPPKKKKLSYKQSTRLKELENLIEQNDERLEQIKQLLANPSDNTEEMAKAYQDFEIIQTNLDKYMAEWEELASLA